MPFDTATFNSLSAAIADGAHALRNVPSDHLRHDAARKRTITNVLTPIAQMYGVSMDALTTGVSKAFFG